MSMENNQAPTESSANRPSLMSKPSLSPVNKEAALDDSRILSNLNNPSTTAPAFGQPAKKSSSFKTLLFVLLGAGVVAFGYQYFNILQTQGAKSNPKPYVIIDEKAEDAGRPAKTATAPSAAAAAAVASAPVAVVAMVGTAPNEAAQIINEPIPKAEAPSTAKLTIALEDGVKPPPAVLSKALEGKASANDSQASINNPLGALKGSPAAAAPGQATQAQAAPAMAATSAAKTEVAKVEPAKVADPVVAKAAPRAAPAAVDRKPDGDKDVNLIAALIANTPTGKPAPAATAAAPAAGAAAAKTAAPVSPAPAYAASDATSLALKQCGELNIFEREVCRVKTCNNQWETNAACKASLNANNTTAPDTTKR
jgi:hypothetical protein